MHHFIYPSQDTFITNTLDYEDLNFGLDETLRVGTQNITSKVYFPTTIYPFPSGSFVTNLCVEGFSGSVSTASFYGSASQVLGRIFDTSVDPVEFTVDYFSGSFVGSAVGWESGSYISSSNATGSFTHFSGTIVIHSLVTGSTWDGLLFEYTNWLTTWDTVLSGSGSIDGWLSGSLSGSYIAIFNGSLVGFTGKILIGNIDGADVKYVPHTEIVNSPYANRALVQFDVSSISASMSAPTGSVPDITNPQFKLKLKVAREYNLPIKYQVYAFPISESWLMGDGYISDNGSSYGASWVYRDKQGGTPWKTTGSSYVQSLSVTESFDYQVGDINMDVTPIVMAWISGSIPNNGIVLISSEEWYPTGSGIGLYFFSKDTNTIYEPILDVAWHDSSEGWSTGSVSTSSVNFGTLPAGLLGIVTDSASISGSLYGGFTGFGNISFVAETSSSYSQSFSGSVTQSFTSSVTFSYGTASGDIVASGVSGLITSMSIWGNFSGSISSSIGPVFTKCNSCKPNFHAGTGDYDFDDSKPFYPSAGDDNAYLDWTVIDGQFPGQYGGCPNIPSFIEAGLWYLKTYPPKQDVYGWNHQFNTFNQYDWTSDHLYQQEMGPLGCSALYNTTCSGCGVHQITKSYVMGTLLDGNFSGSTFTSSLINGYILGYGYLIGGWDALMISGTFISSSYPFKPMYPAFVNVFFFGPYVNGPAFGSLTQISASLSSSYNNSGVFDGVFTGGQLSGLHIHAPFTGSILTASLSYTASVTLTSSSLSPVNWGQMFTTVIQNIPSTVKAGNIIRVNVFARPQFPLKNFNRQTQFTQFLIPQYLPTSSYYAIKDNETEEIILDFDNYTQLSCDPNGNYFMLDTTGFPQERYFKLLIKTEASGSIYTFDKGNVFKIVR